MDISDGASLGDTSASKLNPTPVPGCSSVDRIRPILMAKAVVTRYSAMVRAPIRPIFCGSRMEVIPTTSVEKTSGTISIMIALMKISPSGLKMLAVSPSNAPAKIPSARPARIFFHSAIPRHHANFPCCAVLCPALRFSC